MIEVPEMLSINAAAEKTGLPKHFIREAALTHKVHSVRSGSRKIWINMESLARYLNGQEG